MQEKIHAYSTFNLTLCNNLFGSRRVESGTKARLAIGFASDLHMQVGER